MVKTNYGVAVICSGELYVQDLAARTYPQMFSQYERDGIFRIKDIALLFLSVLFPSPRLLAGFFFFTMCINPLLWCNSLFSSI
jgi:hypothetical protein